MRPANHLEALGNLFLQVLALCQRAGLVKLGHVALDGTKVKANASRNKAMSYRRMQDKEKQLKSWHWRWGSRRLFRPSALGLTLGSTTGRCTSGATKSSGCSAG